MLQIWGDAVQKMKKVIRFGSMYRPGHSKKLTRSTVLGRTHVPQSRDAARSDRLLHLALLYRHIGVDQGRFPLDLFR